MKTNSGMVAKAAFDTSSLVNGGKMNAEQADKFLTFMHKYYC